MTHKARVTVWQDGYVAGIDYAHAFYPELAPTWLAFALARAGILPPDPAADGFAYCELGCGQGLTANMLAAIHPNGEFQAVDFLAPHIEGARALATASGNANAAFFDDSFAAFAARPGPDFDVIALHGVWSWVADEQRAVLVDILAKRLKPGGAVILSYNCLPGWAADMPVRRLLLDHVAAGQGDLPGRIADALRFAREIAGLGGYFDRVPSAARHLDSLEDRTDSYIAHEYLNHDWAPFYHADVVRALAPAGLRFAASATMLDHLDHWRMAPEAAAAVAATADPIRREALRDVLAHTRFRRDVFVKDASRLDCAERERRLMATSFGLTIPRADIPEGVTIPGGGPAPSVELFAPLADALADGPRPLAELVAPGRDFDRVLEAVTALAGLGAVTPVPPPHSRRAARLHAFNTAALARPFAIRQLASPVLGTAMVVDLLDRLFLAAETRGCEPAAFAWDALSARGKRLRRDGAWLETPQDNLAELARLHREFTRREKWRDLGVNGAIPRPMSQR